MDLDFDQDLYKYKSVSCANFECEKSVIDCTCDYTSKLECGRTVSNDSSCTPCKTQININPQAEYYLYYCDENEDWTAVEANKKYKFSITQQLNIRYKANSAICEGLRIYLNQDQGSATMNVSPLPYFSYFGRNGPTSSTDYPIQLNICPTDNQRSYTPSPYWTNDTYFITIWPTSTMADITFEIISQPISNDPISNTCDEILQTHQCVVDGAAVSGQGQDEEYHFYTYTVHEPQTVAFSFPSLKEDVDFYISDDPNQTEPNAFSNPKWDCSNERDDYLTLKLKPISDTEPLVLYIGVVTFYASNYTFTITSQGYNEIVPITDDSPKAGTFSLLGSSRLFLPNGDIFSCTAWSRCQQFSIQYPFSQNLPIWPLPTKFISDKRFGGLIFETPDDSINPIDGKGYRAAFLLSYNQGGKNTLNADFETLKGAKIQFLSNIVDKTGENALSGTFGFTNRSLSCDYDKFTQVTSIIDSSEDSLFNTTDFYKLNSIIFKISSLTLTDEWNACSDMALKLLDTVTEKKPLMTTTCPYLTSDPRFNTDPCCNSSLSFFSCCVPRMTNIPTISYLGVNEDFVSDQCSSPECTTSVLGEYQQSLLSTQDCNVEGFVQDESNVEMLTVLRQCKSKVLQYTKCNSDSDCTSGVTCDLYSRYCLIPPINQDKDYLKCVFENLPITYKLLLTYKHGLNSSTLEETVEKAFDKFSAIDCTYITGQAYRTHYDYYTDYADYLRCYNYPTCVDFTCETIHDVCYDGGFGGWVKVVNSQIDICEDGLGFCNNNNMVCDPSLPIADCADECNSSPPFCGYCSTNITDCFSISEVVNESDCNSQQTCLLGNGIYDNEITKDQCEEQGYCDQPCGYQCSSLIEGFCIVLNLDNNTCTGTGMTWNDDWGLCYTSEPCTGQDYYEVDCTSKPYSECFSSFETPFNLCSIQEIQCQTKQECENTGGECSDSYFFSTNNVDFYPQSYGKCVRPHYAYKSFWPIPTCEIDYEKDSPLGCYPYYFDEYTPLDEESCLNQGPEFKWWTPTATKDQCLQKNGCQILDTKNFFNLPYNFRFNEMTQEECSACGSDTFKQWKNMFTWTAGTWKGGVWVNTTWMPSSYIYPGKLDTLLDYQLLFTELEGSVTSHITDLYRSESLCRMERVEENLKSISCSCSSQQGGSECFSSSSLVLGETKPCQGGNSSYLFDNGVIYFTPESVTFACTSVLVSQVSKQLYKSTTPQSLSSSFVSYRKPDNYGVLNSKDAIIGTILNDGIKISSPGIQTLTLCFTWSSEFDSESDKYPTFDFAMEDTNSTKLTPMEIEYYSKTVTNTNQGNGTSSVLYYCSDLVLSTGSTSISVFPIHRINDWSDANKQVFDSTAKGLLYTLAVFFLLTSLWGIYQLAVVIYKKYTKLEEIKLVHSLVFAVTLFITIRAIYFFILPSGSLSDNPVGDYILVVLPTFIYFTSFTIIIVLWYIIIKTKQVSRDIIQRVTYVIAVVNIILYLLFIVIILVFHFTESDPPDNCGGRIIVNVSSTTPQRAVSIFYAVFQALISLIIGAAFIYLGGSLYLAMRFKKVSETNNQTEQHQKIFIITFACSIGFILHCVFVLILVGAEPSNVVFSFLGLIITEIIPSLSIFYSYNQGNLTGIKQTTDTSKLQYLSSENHENFYSTTSKSSTTSSAANSSMSSISTRSFK